MKRWIGMAVLVFVATAGWRIGDALSPDALSMAVGILFGVLAGVPAALLVIAGSRRREQDERSRQAERGYPARPAGAWGQPYFPPQPPVIVVAPPAVGPGGQEHPAWLPPRRDRQFKVVGEVEEWVQE
jgi:hypothetical protein